jgi:glycosyltransferase involved in cell wall biosynthesis
VSRPLRVAIYGNNLDTGYRFARFLRAHGVVARLFCIRYSHGQDAHPWWEDQAPDPELVEFLELDALPVGRLKPLRRIPAISDLYRKAAAYDVLVLSEDGPAVFSAMNGMPRLFVSFGADLQVLPVLIGTHWTVTRSTRALAAAWAARTGDPRRSALRRALVQLVFEVKELLGLGMIQARQRAGIAGADRVVCFPYQKPLAVRLGVPEERIVTNLPLPMDGDLLATRNTAGIEPLLERLSGCRLVFFHPTRQLHLATGDTRFLKGNDRLIRAYARFARKRSPRGLRLVLVRKGRAQDIAASERLISELGIAEHCEWVPEMENKQLRAVMALPNVVICDQFDESMAAMGNIGREACSFGRILLTAFSEQNARAFAVPPPNLLPAKSEEEIGRALEHVLDLTDARRAEIGAQARAWFTEHLDWRRVVPRYVDLLQDMAASGRTHA